MNLIKEMQDDPQWDANAAFTWDRYWTYLANPKVYATTFNIVSFVKKTGTPVDIYNIDQQGKLVKVFSEAGNPHKETMSVVFSAKHSSPRRRVPRSAVPALAVGKAVKMHPRRQGLVSQVVQMLARWVQMTTS